MLIFCRRIVVKKPEMLRKEGPLLLAANHPNSFLDSVIINALFKRPVWSLARGDAFRRPLANRLLRALHILPVYRVSEGVENLSGNYETFHSCMEIFRENGIVSIYSEGKCINEWHLRPLKKGTARLASLAWQEKVPLTVLPVSINYSSFRRFGKNVFIQFGNPIEAKMFSHHHPDGQRHLGFNQILRRELEAGVFEISKQDLVTQKKLLQLKPALAKKILLFLPALAGWLIHAPLYLPVRGLARKKYGHSDHFDSVLVSLLLITYPVYLLMITSLIFLITKNGWAWSLLLVLPFTAWAYTQLKSQLDRV